MPRAVDAVTDQQAAEILSEPGVALAARSSASTQTSSAIDWAESDASWLAALTV